MTTGELSRGRLQTPELDAATTASFLARARELAALPPVDGRDIIFGVRPSDFVPVVDPPVVAAVRAGLCKLCTTSEATVSIGCECQCVALCRACADSIEPVTSASGRARKWCNNLGGGGDVGRGEAAACD